MLWDIADTPAAFFDRLTTDGAVPPLSGSWPSSTLSSEVLPVPLGPSTAMNSPGAHGEVEVVPQHPVAEGQPGAGQLGNDVSSHKR